jgi:NADPH:quinone reductase-like Zn-dependent oxidoreductase
MTKVAPNYPVPESGGAVLITGASTGIGLHAASVLAENGFRVYAGVRSEKAKEEVKKMVPGGANYVSGDLIWDRLISWDFNGIRIGVYIMMGFEFDLK